MAAANITVIGSLNIDHIFFIDRLPKLGESYEAKRYEKALGGKGANAAIAAIAAVTGSQSQRLMKRSVPTSMCAW